MKVIGLVVKRKDMEKKYMKMVNIILGNGKIIKDMEKGYIIIKMEKSDMKVIMLMACLKEMVYYI